MKRFGLIGEKLGHSYSPLIHSKLGTYEYVLCETAEQDLAARLQDPSFDGFNITIPYKKKVMAWCDTLSDTAQAIGSVNTVVRGNDGRLHGYNTDYEGFQYLLTYAGIDVAKRKCVVLGSGGASLTVQAVLRDLGAKEIVVVSRTGAHNYDNLELQYDAEIVINTTPVGMYPNNGDAPVEISEFFNCRGVVDLIYNPNRTRLVLDAMACGLPATGGLPMLVAQAQAAGALFTGQTVEAEELHDLVDEIRTETLNTILIGMPGAGKTLLGGEIANRMGRKFVDIDDLIEAHEGMTIPEIFAQKGEAYFRKVESEMLARACVQTGLVIATGGGIVKKRSNYNILRQNGTVIWIKRDLEKLETDGRPLSQRMPLEEIYAERKDRYESWSDFFINNNEERE